MQASLSIVRRLAHSLGASMTVQREHELFSDFYTGESLRRRMADLLIRKVPDYQEFIDLRIAVLGCADTRKSTVVGVITQGEMDNGKGRARLNRFNRVQASFCHAGSGCKYGSCRNHQRAHWTRDGAKGSNSSW